MMMMRRRRRRRRRDPSTYLSGGASVEKGFGYGDDGMKRFGGHP